MIKMPKPMEFTVDTSSSVDIFLEAQKRTVSTRLADFLIWALENNADSFIFAEVKVEHEDGCLDEFKLGCKRPDYLEALRKQLKHLIDFEEYERCPKIKEWIEYLELAENINYDKR